MYHGIVFSFKGSGVVVIGRAFFLSMDLGRSYHGSVSSANGSGFVRIMGVFFLSMNLESFLAGESFFHWAGPRLISFNGLRSFLSWECFSLRIQVILIMGVVLLWIWGRSYQGSVSSFNGPRSFLSWECFFC